MKLPVPASFFQTAPGCGLITDRNLQLAMPSGPIELSHSRMVQTIELMRRESRVWMERVVSMTSPFRIRTMYERTIKLERDIG